MADNKCSTPDCGGNCDSCNGDITVTLTLDNDETVECAILTIFPVDGRDYIALLPLDENGENEDGEVYLYRYDNSPQSARPGKGPEAPVPRIRPPPRHCNRRRPL